jgi:hypothetical protein
LTYNGEQSYSEEMKNDKIVKALNKEQLETLILVIMKRWDFVNHCEFPLYLEEAVGVNLARQLLSGELP